MTLLPNRPFLEIREEGGPALGGVLKEVESFQ